MKSSPLLAVLLLVLSGVGQANAQSLFWNPSPLTGNWSTSDATWASTSGGTANLTWTNLANATFDQANTYTVNLTSSQNATNVNITAGNVTFTGARLVTSGAISIGSSATVSSDNATLFRASGATTMSVNGSLRLTSALSTAQWVTVTGGTGSISLLSGASLRVGGGFNFSGNISGDGGFFTQDVGNVVLAGSNTYSGATLFRHNGVVRFNSASALSSSSYLRFGDAANLTLELAGGDLIRTVSDTASGTNARIEGSGVTLAFAAIGANRNVAFTGASWGATSFNPVSLQLGTSASTQTVVWTSNLNLGGGNRTFIAVNGSAAVGGRISGNLTNGNLVKAGNGTLALSGNNSFSSATFNYGTASSNLGAIRLESNNALGGIATVVGANGNSTIARIELANNVSIGGIEYQIGGRGNASTTGAALVNISGNNTWSGNLAMTSDGAGFGLRSDAGRLTLSGSLTNALAANSTWTFAGAGDFLVSGNITNANFTKLGAGTLVLSGVNSFNSTTLSYGTASTDLGAIRLESNNALGGITLIDGFNGTNTAVARIELANDVTISGINYEAGGRNNSTTTGASIVNISGNNTWTGNVRITNSGGGFGLRSDAGRLTLSGNLSNSFTSDRVWTFAGEGDFLVSGNVTNGGSFALGIAKQGNGTLQITGGLSYNGVTSITGGTLDFAQASGTNALTGNVTGSAANFVKSGGGTLVVDNRFGPGNNTFSGNVVVNAGVLRLGNSTNTSRGLNSALSYTINSGGTLEYGRDAMSANPVTLNGTLRTATGGGYTNFGAITMNGGNLSITQGVSGSFAGAGLGQNLTVSGTSASFISTNNTTATDRGLHIVHNAANASRTFLVNDVTGDANEDLIVTARLLNSSNGLGNSSLVKAGAGTMALYNTTTFNGSTTVSSGVLRLAAANSLGSTSAVNVDTGATLEITASNAVNDSATVSLGGGTIAKGAGTITETFGALTLTANSSLDFGSGTGSFTFATFTPGSFVLTLQNFNLGNSLNVTTGTFDASKFNFGSFDYSWATEGSGFTITAIPEPSSVAAAAVLLAFSLFGARAGKKRTKRISSPENGSSVRRRDRI